MKPVPVNWSDLEIAFERNAPTLESYIRKSTGEVVSVVEGAPGADEVRRETRERPDAFVRIDPVPSREQYRWMERFIASVEDEDLRRRLLISIDGKGAFRRFKNVLLSNPVERERWYAYRGDWLHRYINEWITARALPTATPPPWGLHVEVPELPEPLPRARPAGESIAEQLRRRAHEAVEVLPAGELPGALAFLEFLRDRGGAALTAPRVRLDAEPRRGVRVEDDDVDSDDDEHDRAAGADPASGTG